MRRILSTLIPALAIMLGGITMMTVALCLLDASADALIKEPKAEIKTQPVSGPVTGLQAEVWSADLEILPSEDGSCSVSYPEVEKVSYAIEVEEGILTVRRLDQRKWYERIRLFSFSSSTVTVRLPRGSYESLTAQSHSFGVEVGDGLTFNRATVKATSGSVHYLADAKEELNLSVTSGNLYVKGVCAKEIRGSVTSGTLELEDIACNNLSLSGTSGATKLSKTTASQSVAVKQTSGSVKLSEVVSRGDFSVKVTSGSVRLDRCDGESLAIETSSGSVRGTLRSPKVFNVTTTSGSVNVPPSVPHTGLCRIKTTSGDVNLTVVQE